MRGPLTLLFAVASWFVATSAGAHGSGGTQLPRDPAAVTDEGARAKAVAAEVRAAAKTPPADVAASLDRTQHALARASGAHGAGDSRTARLLGKVALGWAEAAKAQLAATRAERASGDAEKAAVDLSARRERGRALIIESQARRGQLASQIERKKLEVEAAKAPKEKPKPEGKRSEPKAAAGGAAPARKADEPPTKKPAEKAPAKKVTP